MAAEPRLLQELHTLIVPAVGQEAADKLVNVLREFDTDRLATKADMARVDDRFEQIDARFEQIDARFEEVDRRFEQIDARFEDVDRRFEQVDHRFELLETSLMGKIDSTKNEVVAAFRGELVAAVSGQTRTLLLGMLGAVVTMAGVAVAFARLL